MNTSNHKPIGNNIRKWRTLKNFKQVDFAKEIGISKATLSKIENNKQQISVLRLAKIASCLKIKTTQLFDDPQDLLPPPSRIILNELP